MKKIIEFFVGKVVAWHAKRYPIKRCESFGEAERSEIKTIVIYSNKALGDSIVSTPAIQRMREIFPQAKIVWFIHKDYLKLFAETKIVNGFLTYHGGYKKFISNVLALRQLKPDMALLLHSNGPQDIQSAVLSGAKWIFKNLTNPATDTTYLSHVSEILRLHFIEERLKFVEFLAQGLSLKKPSKCMWLGIDSKKTRHLDISGDEKKIGFQLGASYVYRMWPMEFYAALAQKLWREDKRIRIVLLGSSQERGLVDSFRGYLTEAEQDDIVDKVGKTTIEELPWLLSELSVVVAGDTGTMHLAVALGIPTVALFANSYPQESGIIQDVDRHVVIDKSGEGIEDRAISKKNRTDAPMRRIGVDEVFEAIKQLLQRGKNENSVHQ